MPRLAAIADISANGSIATVLSAAVRRKADWPYHSTCMLFLSGGGWDDCARSVARRRRSGAVRGSVARRCSVRIGPDLPVTGGAGAVGGVILAAAHQRRGRGDQAGDDRKRERLVQAGTKRR